MTSDRIKQWMPLLEYLIGGHPVSFSLLRYDLGLEPEQIQEGLHLLNSHGCDITFTGASECQLIQTGFPVWQDFIDYALALYQQAPMNVRVYRETTSTQDVAKTSGGKPTVVIAGHQTAGRGRRNKRWESSEGTGVMLSVAWPCDRRSITIDRLSMLTGVALAQVIEKLAPDADIRLKWPNDILAEGKKLSGILIESTNEAAVIGIGINVTGAPHIDGKKTNCLKDISGKSMDRLYVIEKVILGLVQTLRSPNQMLMLDEWRTRASLGQTQTFEHNNQQITGDVLDLDPDHGLIVRRDTGEIVTLPAATTSVVA